MNSKFYGYLLGALAAASYGTNPLFALPLMHAGLNAGSVLFLRYCFAIPMLAIMMAFRGRGFGMRRGQWLPVIFMGVLMGYSSLSLYIAYNYIGASIASTMLFVYPILVTVIMSLVYHEKASRGTILCIAVATLGIMLLYHGDGGETLSTRGVIIVFSSAIAYAIYLVGCNRPKLNVIPTLKLTFYVIVFGMLVFIPFFDIHSFAILNSQPKLWLSAFGLAFFPTAVSLLATSAAIVRVGSTPVAILGALEPVTAVVIAVSIFGEPLTFRLTLGMTLVIIAVTLIISGGAVEHSMMRVRKMFPKIKHNK